VSVFERPPAETLTLLEELEKQAAAGFGSRQRAQGAPQTGSIELQITEDRVALRSKAKDTLKVLPDFKCSTK
jgi:hypothetical protein